MTRTCANPECTTIPNSYNRDPYCYLCQDRIPEDEKIQLCTICGATILGRQSWVRYCSEPCRKEGQRRVNRASRLRVSAA